MGNKPLLRLHLVGGTWHYGGRALWYNTRWWFQIFFIFTPIPGEIIQSDEHVFQRGWFDHQLEKPKKTSIYICHWNPGRVYTCGWWLMVCWFFSFLTPKPGPVFVEIVSHTIHVWICMVYLPSYDTQFHEFPPKFWSSSPSSEGWQLTLGAWVPSRWWMPFEVGCNWPLNEWKHKKHCCGCLGVSKVLHQVIQSDIFIHQLEVT